MVYPISEAIERLMAEAVDIETGEILLTDEELQQKLDCIQMEFDSKVVELRNEYINLLAEADAIKAERQKLAKRQKVAEAAAERTKRFLAYLLKGEKFQNGAAKISYRRSEEIVCDDDFIEWAAVHCPDYLNYKEPEPRKTDIKNAMKRGEVFEHVTLQQKNNIIVR